MCPDLETLQITATHHTCLQRGTHVQTIQGVARFKQNMYSVQHFACVITGTKVHKLQKTQKLEKNCGFVCIIPKHCYEGLQRKLSLRSSFVSHVCNAVTQQVGLCSTHSQISLLQTVNSDAARSHVQAQDTKRKYSSRPVPKSMSRQRVAGKHYGAVTSTCGLRFFVVAKKITCTVERALPNMKAFSAYNRSQPFTTKIYSGVMSDHSLLNNISFPPPFLHTEASSTFFSPTYTFFSAKLHTVKLRYPRTKTSFPHIELT